MRHSYLPRLVNIYSGSCHGIDMLDERFSNYEACHINLSLIEKNGGECAFQSFLNQKLVFKLQCSYLFTNAVVLLPSPELMGSYPVSFTQVDNSKWQLR